jgi:hypothetical protein
LTDLSPLSPQLCELCEDRVTPKGLLKTVIAADRVRLAANGSHIEIKGAAAVYFIVTTNRFQ